MSLMSDQETLKASIYLLQTCVQKTIGASALLESRRALTLKRKILIKTTARVFESGATHRPVKEDTKLH